MKMMNQWHIWISPINQTDNQIDNQIDNRIGLKMKYLFLGSMNKLKINCNKDKIW